MTPACQKCGAPLRTNTPGGHCPRCLLQLASPAGASGDKATDPELPDSLAAELLDPAQVRHFGDYELIEEIARGGMGIVYRAHQRSLNRPVAVKMILAGQLATPESVQRFRLEAEAAANLHHPHIVPIYEIGEHETQHYFAMKFVEGGDLAQAMSRISLRAVPVNQRSARRQRQREIVALMMKVGDALSYAHQRGVLHRDLKPSNILMDAAGEPHLTDFGLAKLADRASGLTVASAVLGSPAYMAPEQAAGKVAELTTAADIYGLGAVLYELLTGRPPFTGESPMEILRKVMDEEPVRVAKRVPDVDRDLETICHRCLESHPARRYRSARAFCEELERFCRDEPIEARPVGPAERLRRWCRRRPAVAGLGAAAIAVALVGLAGVLWQWRRAEISRRETQAANTNLLHTLDHLEWRSIDTMVAQDYAGRAVAHLADRLRRAPGSWQAATFAQSVLEQRAFAMPAGPEVVLTNALATAPPVLSPDGTRLALATREPRLRVLDVASSRDIYAVSLPAGDVVSLAFHPDGSSLAVGTGAGTITFFDAASGQPIARLTTPATPLREVVFSRDAQVFAVAGGNIVQHWRSPDALAGRAPRRLEPRWPPRAGLGHARNPTADGLGCRRAHAALHPAAWRRNARRRDGRRGDPRRRDHRRLGGDRVGSGVRPGTGENHQRPFDRLPVGAVARRRTSGVGVSPRGGARVLGGDRPAAGQADPASVPPQLGDRG